MVSRTFTNQEAILSEMKTQKETSLVSRLPLERSLVVVVSFSLGLNLSTPSSAPVLTLDRWRFVADLHKQTKHLQHAQGGGICMTEDDENMHNCR